MAELEAGEVAFEVLEAHPERESTLELLGHSAESSVPQEERPVILPICWQGFPYRIKLLSSSRKRRPQLALKK